MSSENDILADEPFVEIDPTGRYGRYSDLIGSGAVKNVYRGFDLVEAKEVAWNQVSLRRLKNDKSTIARLFTEIHLVRSLRNDNIISGSDVWNDNDKTTLNFITELCNSGNLRDYRMKHEHVGMKTLKKWSLQILKGLGYLHAHEPRVIHRDLNLSNVFINGNSGEVKIGDFGLASVTKNRSDTLSSMVGTPEFMAPEIYDERYGEAVDVYAFGLSVLELVTREIPYSECGTLMEIYEKVRSGVRPRALEAVADLEVKRFIEKCLVRESERPSVPELLRDSFFDELNNDNNDFFLEFDKLNCVESVDHVNVLCTVEKIYVES